MADVKFGLFLPTSDFEESLQAAKAAEKAGFFSVSMNDHFFTPFGTPETPQLECFTTLTAIAAVTEKIYMVPAVTAISFRTPPHLAKVVTTLDHVSRGRFIMGLGAGWKPDEYHSHGYPFPSTPVRLEQLRETIQILKAMWLEDKPTFQGTHFKIENAFNNPRSFQKPHPPIMLGGSGTGLLRIAAEFGDMVNIIPATGDGKDFPNDPVVTRNFDDARLLSRIELLKTLTKEAGRDADEVSLSGLTLLIVSEDDADPMFAEVSGQLGFPDVEAARKSPLIHFGTPEQVTEELQERIKTTGIAYNIVAPLNPESQALFSEKVLPEF